MNKNFIKTIFLNFFITIGMSISMFLVNKYFIEYMGIKNLGLMKLFTQLLNYLNFAEIGLASASTFALYKPLVDKNYHKINEIITTISSLYNKIFIIIIVIGLLLNPLIPYFIKDKIPIHIIFLYWSLYVINTALGYTYVKYSILLTADQHYGLVRLIQGGSRIFCQILQILVIIKYKSFLFFILLLFVDNIIQYTLYTYVYRKHYKYIKKSLKKDLSIVNDLKKLVWHKLSTLVIYNTDLILISKFVSLDIVGIYSSYTMIVQMIIVILGVILNVLSPRIGKFIAENNKKIIFECWKKLNILFLFLSLWFCMCCYFLINDFIILWIGKTYIFSTVTVTLILINLFFQCFRGITDIFKEGSGFFDDIHLPIIESIINFIVSIILVRFIGLNGVIIGTIMSNVLIIFIARPILVFRRCFGQNMIKYLQIYFGYIILILSSIIIVMIAMNIFSIKMNKISWLNWIINATYISFLVFCILMIVFCMNKYFRRILLGIIHLKSINTNKK